jgi:hypothetical protein
MKRAWFVLLVSAFTNGGITAMSGIVPLLGIKESTWRDMILPVVLGTIVAFRYVAGQLKMTPEISAALMGKSVVTLTQTPNAVVQVTPTETVLATTPAHVVAVDELATTLAVAERALEAARAAMEARAALIRAAATSQVKPAPAPAQA